MNKETDRLVIPPQWRYDGHSLLLQGLTIALMGLGIVMIYSAQWRVDKLSELETFWASPASKQILYATIGLVLMLIFSRIDYRIFYPDSERAKSIGLWFLVIAIASLILVYVPKIGIEINGAKRWVKLGGFTFQPSEFAKLAMVIFLATKLADADFPRKSFFRGLVPVSLLIGVVCGLIGKEDLGTAAVIAMVCGLMLITGGIKLWHLILPTIPGIMGFIYLIIAEPYRMKRVVSFMNIWDDPRGANYHPIQSLIAIATGNWWGLGLGEGIQKYGYLPEDTTDFIFSILCEEVGMIGGVSILLMFIVLIIVGWRIFRNVPDEFGKLMVFGLICMIGLQAVMNVAVVTVSMPTKGIALPFVSAGGSGLIFAAISIGIICSVSRFSERV
jgi:cell division protein FtsW